MAQGLLNMLYANMIAIVRLKPTGTCISIVITAMKPFA
jgi:hypothetical protein